MWSNLAAESKKIDDMKENKSHELEKKKRIGGCLEIEMRERKVREPGRSTC